MSNERLAPRDWKTTNAISDAKKQTLLLKPVTPRKEFSVFDREKTSRRKKRPITLPSLENKA